MCAPDNHLNTITLNFEEACTYGTHQQINEYASLTSDWTHQAPFGPIHTVTFNF